MLDRVPPPPQPDADCLAEGDRGCLQGECVKRACELLEVSRSAYYEPRAVQAAGGSADAAPTERIRTNHTGSGGTYGSRGCTPS